MRPTYTVNQDGTTTVTHGVRSFTATHKADAGLFLQECAHVCSECGEPIAVTDETGELISGPADELGVDGEPCCPSCKAGLHDGFFMSHPRVCRDFAKFNSKV